jgi:hypothetical protein
LQYNIVVQQTGANFRTVVTAGNIHEVNQRDKVIVAMFAQLMAQGNKIDLVNAPVPFDIL